ncbi:MAG TPA: ABC transporter permease subunit [Candidatus Hydrogenedentes bacterium]|nr:ABC transporter permease subunit [Candidatus Hydrogenedentota bacterium]
MNIELLKMFLLQHAKLTAAVGIGAGALSVFLMVLFPNMPSSDAALIAASWPEMVKELFGDPLRGFCDIHAWASLQMFHITYWVIYGCLAALLASCIIAKEIEGKTFDILLSCPIGRMELIVSRVVALFLLLAAAALPVFAGTSIGIMLKGLTPRLGDIFMATVDGLLLAFVCGALTLLVSVLLPNRILSVLSALAIFMALFFYEAMLVPLFPLLKRLSFMSLFHFYEADRILLDGTSSLTAPLALGCVSMALIAAAVVLFRRRDIPL